MVILGVSLSLDVPVLDAADDVAFVGGAKHELDLVTAVAVGALKEEVEPAGSLLTPLTLDEDELALRHLLGR